MKEQWNPLLAQLEGAAAMGDSCSRLVLQSLVAQSANVLKKLMAENKRLEATVERYADAMEEDGNV